MLTEYKAEHSRSSRIVCTFLLCLALNLLETEFRSWVFGQLCFLRLLWASRWFLKWTRTKKKWFGLLTQVSICRIWEGPRYLVLTRFGSDRDSQSLNGTMCRLLWLNSKFGTTRQGLLLGFEGLAPRLSCCHLWRTWWCCSCLLCLVMIYRLLLGLFRCLALLWFNEIWVGLGFGLIMMLMEGKIIWIFFIE